MRPQHPVRAAPLSKQAQLAGPRFRFDDRGQRQIREKMPRISEERFPSVYDTFSQNVSFR